MSARKRAVDTPVATPSVSDVVSKAIKSNSEWSDKKQQQLLFLIKIRDSSTAKVFEYPHLDEFLDVIYWMRQIIGVVIGIVWGVVPLKGFLGLILFFAVSTIVVYLYSTTFQKIDDEEMGGLTEILKEGLMTSFATFLISWIILYSALHF